MAINLAPLVGIGRLAFGAAAYAAPKPVADAMKMPSVGATTDTRYMTRLFGARDLIIGLATVLPATRSTALRLGVAADVLDAISGILTGNEGAPKDQVAKSAGIAGGYAVLGIAAAAQGR